jgi:hypothetical protein
LPDSDDLWRLNGYQRLDVIAPPDKGITLLGGMEATVIGASNTRARAGDVVQHGFDHVWLAARCRPYMLVAATGGGVMTAKIIGRTCSTRCGSAALNVKPALSRGEGSDGRSSVDGKKTEPASHLIPKAVAIAQTRLGMA